jgi:hypothetical protein
MATFFTLGRASYLDVCLTGKDQELNYYQAVRKSNELLLSHFSDLYSRLLESLYSELADPVTYTDKLARPGFHVFLGSAISAAGQARAHFDVQYDKLQFGGKPDSVEPISFTLPLRLPRGGSGLETWNVTRDRYENAVRQGMVRSLHDYAEQKVRAYHPYTPGVLFVHKGLLLHRIASPGVIHPEDERVTLQGHGLRIAGKWLLYW